MCVSHFLWFSGGPQPGPTGPYDIPPPPQEKKEIGFQFKKSNGETVIKKENEKIITCQDCFPKATSWNSFVSKDGYKYRCKSCGFIGDYNDDVVKIGWEHLDNSPSCVKFGKEGPDDSYLASRKKCRDCGKDNCSERIRGDDIHGVDHGMNGPWEYLCSDCSTFGEKESFKDLKCEDWETNKKRVRDEAVYFSGFRGLGKFYDKDKKVIATRNGTDDFTGSFWRCSQCQKNIEWKRNNFGDEWITEGHKIENGEIVHLSNNNNSSTNQPQTNQHLPTLIQIQQYFTANNIHSITNQNGNLVITFNQSTTNPNSPPPQTITDEELSETSTLMEPEQKTMWKKFKDYLKKIGKNKMNKQELEQEINKLKTNSEQKPNETKIWPFVVGGIGIVAVLGIILLINRKKRIRK